MFLTVERYCSGFGFAAAEERAMYRKALELAGTTELACAEAPHLTIVTTVAYWRNANAIHGWFVRETQDGKDECQTSYVTRTQLLQLAGICGRLLQTRDADEAAAKLPPVPGIFFGNTEIDNWYWQSLEDTIRQLERVVTADKLLTFNYRASW